MGEAFVAVRLPSAGTLLGDAVARHPRARITSVPEPGAAEPGAATLLALVEGLPDAALADLLLAWNRRYGAPVQVLGDSFALRLPVRTEGLREPALAELLRLMHELPLAGAVGEGDWTEQWYRCAGPAEAEAVAARLRQATRGVPGASVRLGTPRQHDLDCWEVLRFAAGAEPVAAH